MPRQINTIVGEIGVTMCNDSRSYLVFIYVWKPRQKHISKFSLVLL
ncbi:unnamed protein product [Tenebrio molitor]|nr:unnamed protein product [Tenebrio molitor]